IGAVGDVPARLDALAGLILGAASVNAVVVLDGPATGKAAHRAIELAPEVAGYVLAGHAGAGRGFDPVFDIGLGTGDGAGAAVILPFVVRAASL
ncbi:MAG TPA: nicotinate-nucleotide--dimethylbenzimidazole phosphoribosyltransferase, partial [Galbitalea sp.]